MKNWFVLLLGLFFLPDGQAQITDCDPDMPPIRYRSRDFFASNQVINNVAYRSGDTEASTMNIFLPPSTDTETQRPLVMWAHPGGFVNGSKDTDTANQWCETLARMGFVCVSIDYRKELLGDALIFRAGRGAYKGIQDGRSAVRFMKANAATYGVNPNDVYFAGESAGGIISINVAYMEDAERPSDSQGGLFISNLGDPDNGAGALVDDSVFDGDVEGAIMLWGGVDDPNVIDPVTGSGQTDDEACLLIHGDLDETVSPNVAPPFQDDPLFAILANVFVDDIFGTYPMRQRLNDLGTAAPNWEARVACLEGHGFWVDKTQDPEAGNGNFGSGGVPDENYDYIFNEAVDFLARTRGLVTEASDSISTIVATPTSLAECDDESVGTYADFAFNEYFVVNPTPGSTYCWDVTKGEILSGQGTSLITVRWDDSLNVATNRLGTVMCFETTSDGRLLTGATHFTSIQDDDNSSPNASFTTFMGSTADEINFTNTSTNAVTNDWQFGDGATSTQQSPTHIYTAGIGDYTAQLKITNINGAISESEQLVSVEGFLLQAKVLLEGAYQSITMDLKDDLNQANLIPSTNPFSDTALENFGAAITNDALTNTGDDTVIDWIKVEIKNETTEATQGRAALLLRDGNIVDLDGSSAIPFLGAIAGTYQVTIQHRNHLAVVGTVVVE